MLAGHTAARRRRDALPLDLGQRTASEFAPRPPPCPQYLASRLFEVRSDRDRVRGLQERTQRELERTLEQEASARAHLAAERDGGSRVAAELRAAHAQQLAEARERSAAEMAEAMAKAEADRARLRDQLQAKARTPLASRCTSALALHPADETANPPPPLPLPRHRK